MREEHRRDGALPLAPARIAHANALHALDLVRVRVRVRVRLRVRVGVGVGVGVMGQHATSSARSGWHALSCSTICIAAPSECE